MAAITIGYLNHRTSGPKYKSINARIATKKKAMIMVFFPSLWSFMYLSKRANIVKIHKMEPKK
jgi:hypothetical protein